jgi:hypothetical protein
VRGPSFTPIRHNSVPYIDLSTQAEITVFSKTDLNHLMKFHSWNYRPKQYRIRYMTT